jgi:hypothetical protein
MADDIAEIIRRFRDLDNINVYVIAKLKRIIDEVSSLTTYAPSIPGKVMLQDLPYFFDLVFAMKFQKGSDGSDTRIIQTKGDLQWIAKDRSGKLDKIEKPTLSGIFTKIIGE